MEIPPNSLKSGQFSARVMFLLVSLSAVGIACFSWMPLQWAMVANQVGMLVMAIVVFKTRPILRTLLLTLNFVLWSAGFMLKSGLDIPNFVVGLCVIFYLGASLVQVWQMVSATR